MIDDLHVLSIGTLESNNLIRDVLLARNRCQLFVASEVWDLSVFLASAKVDVAILHGTLSAAEMRSCSVYIRHHWPSAGILLIHADADILDDPMYDERIEPNSSPEKLLNVIERSADHARHGTDSRRIVGT